ncbi:ANTAR domain-containing protein [Streptomyces sp. NPDC001255]|uniref:ANTAR domain-containing protein n=1 Tax=Streptomyces sp. NPDC001255 TaxID=3364550 RepID=UPI003696F2C3
MAARPAATAESEEARRLLAAHAAVALTSSRAQAQTKAAVETGHLIGEATGIPTATHHVTEAAALGVRRRYSRTESLKPRDIARACAHGIL